MQGLGRLFGHYVGKECGGRNFLTDKMWRAGNAVHLVYLCKQAIRPFDFFYIFFPHPFFSLIFLFSFTSCSPLLFLCKPIVFIITESAWEFLLGRELWCYEKKDQKRKTRKSNATTSTYEASTNAKDINHSRVHREAGKVPL